MRILVLLLALSACATVTKESDQRIAVTTEPAGASCILQNGASRYAGTWNIKATPGDTTVRRHYSPLVITCEKDGATASTTVEPHTRPRAYGNILLGGVPAIVDAETGAGYEYRPANAALTLRP